MRYSTFKSTYSCQKITLLPFSLLVVLLLLTSLQTAAQRIKIPTIFEKTDLLIKDQKLDQAYSMIKRYQVSHPTNLDATWKTAQLAYWNWDIDNAKIFYKAAIKLDESNNAIKYDYSKMLFALGDYDEASDLFKHLLVTDPNNLEVWAYRIKAHFYNNDLDGALSAYNEMPDLIKENPDLIDLKNQILYLKAINISISGSYVNDNQPMQTVTSKFRISKMKSALVHWYAEGTYNTFSNDTLKSNSPNFKVGNKFTFVKLKLEADVSLGATVLPRASEFALIGGIVLSQKLGAGASLNAELSRNPYTYSLPSTTNFVLQDNLGIALSISNLEKFSGNIQFQSQKFNDANTIAATSLWFLSPSFGKGKVKGKIGYAYESMNAKNDNFTSVKSLAEILQDFETTNSIAGFYSSYFTPRNQVIHNVLLTAAFTISPKFNINLTGSYGLSAKWDNPYLFLNNNDAGEVFIDKDFTTEKFKPASFKVDVNYVLSQKFNIGLHYNYFKTAFFTANTFMLNLNYKIIREK